MIGQGRRMISVRGGTILRRSESSIRGKAVVVRRAQSSLAEHSMEPSDGMAMVTFLDTLNHAVEGPWKYSVAEPRMMHAHASTMMQSMDMIHPPANVDDFADPDEDMEQELNLLEQQNFEKLMEHHPPSPRERPRDQRTYLLRDLKRAVNYRHPRWSMEAYRRCAEARVTIATGVLRQVFTIQCLSDPFNAMEIMTAMSKTNGPPGVELYEQLCDAIGLLDIKQHGSHGRIEEFVNRIRFKLMTFDVEVQQRLYPRLLVALVKQKVPQVGYKAKQLYRFMKEKKFPLPVTYLEEAMAHARYNRVNDLPYHDLLQRCVDEGHQPKVATAISVLQNLFPFNNFDATMMAMESINALQSKSTDYQVDIGTLEMITAAAATRGRYRICLKAWDILEAQGLGPTDTFYENTITAFAMGFRQDANCFAALGEMEARGYKPTRALIRSITRSIRFSVGRVDFAYQTLIRNEIEGARVTVSSLNTILSGCAELGDPDRAFAMFEDFANFNLEPDEDTYSYMMESLSKATGPERSLDHAAVAAYLKAAESLLDTMAEKSIKVNRHTLHFYIHTLGNLGETDAAQNAVFDALEAGLGVENKTLSLIISACGERGDLDMARLLCSKLSEPMSFIEKRIEQWELDHAEAASSVLLDTSTADGGSGAVRSSPRDTADEP